MLEVNEDDVAMVVLVAKKDLEYLKGRMERDGLSLEHLQNHGIRRFVEWLKERELP